MKLNLNQTQYAKRNGSNKVWLVSYFNESSVALVDENSNRALHVKRVTFENNYTEVL